MKTFKTFMTEASFDPHQMKRHLTYLHDGLKDSLARHTHEESNGPDDIHRNLAAGMRIATENHLEQVRHIMDMHGIGYDK